MGQKINPISLRLQTTNRYFDSCWYSDFYYSELISQDLKIREYINSVLKQIQYPAARFYIQSSQKKIKIFIFFCSPLKSRKVRSNFFKVKYYKTIKKKKTKTINQIVKHLEPYSTTLFSQVKTPPFHGELPSGLVKKIPPFHGELQQKNSIKKSSEFTFSKTKQLNYHKQERKLTYFKYILLSKYLQNLYASTKNQPLFENHPEVKSKDTRVNNLIQSQLIKKKIKKSQTSTNSVLHPKSNRNPSGFVRRMPSLHNWFFFNQKFFLHSLNNKRFVLFSTIQKPYIRENIRNFFRFYKKLTYRKHLETILNRDLLVNANLFSIKLQDHFKSASFLAEDIVFFLERRKPFRLIKNRILKEVKHLSYIKGIRIACSGRVGGRSKKAQRAKTETFKYGQTSLHIFSSRIDFASKKALTPFGLVGIKVWICYID